MSDLSASHCGCNNGVSPINENGGCGNLIWLIILLSCCGNGNGLSPANTFGDGNGSCCNTIIWLLVLLSCCGNNGCNN